MVLTAGTRLGVYQVTAQIGEGGMGQVYRATDTKLKRQVAIKILPPSLAADHDRLARFQREAEVLASLNHPNIAAIYGLEESGGLTALVMELVEGEDLSQRVARGAMLLDEALPVAKQIADALEVAHEQGIIHRDLKPANIKVRPDGTVKVLDFGLAKAIDLSGVSSVNAMNSPTLSMHATQAGIILGTAAYMSPEQAKARTVDKRSDIWAFGAVLYEMLTGERAFKGEDVSETLASILKDTPAFGALPVSTPPRLRRLIERCLERDVKQRLRDIGEARVEIGRIDAGEEDTALSNAGPAVTRRTVVARALPWALTGTLAVALLLVLWTPWRRASPLAPLRLSAELGADVSMTFGYGDALSLSSDGTVVAFVALKRAGGSPQLYVRPIAQLQATALAGTDNAESPFFSPDGRWIGFFADGKLKKIAVTGGAAAVLCDAPLSRGGTWGEDGTIVFQPRTPPGSRLMRVSSSGGPPEAVSSLVEGEVAHRWPQMLPGGQAVLFTGSGTTGSWEDANLVVQTLPTGARTVVQRGGYHGRYAPSGHLIYLHAGALFAAPFDLGRLTVTGAPVLAIPGVISNAASGGAQFAVSASGTLVYLPGESTSGARPIQWMDHEGRTTPLRATSAIWYNPSFSPDGHRLALQIKEGEDGVWVYDLARDTVTRLAFGPDSSSRPVWTPDGRRIVFGSGRAGQSNLYWQRADGIGDTQRLTENKNQQQPASWHPSGKLLAYEENNPQTGYDLMILPMEGDEASGWKPGQPTTFMNTPFAEREPMFSPDGRWLAYVSDETGRSEVYVRPFPGPGGKWQISTGGALFPMWSRTKRELYYGAPSGQIMVAPYTVEGDSFRVERPRRWSEGRFVLLGPTKTFDLHPDGERFAIASIPETPGGSSQAHMTFVLNFFDELRRIAPVRK